MEDYIYKRIPAVQGQNESSAESVLSKQEESNCHSDETRSGLSPITAAFYMVAAIAGAGVLALPKALATLGFLGLIAFGFAGALLGYTGLLLGRCWMLVFTKTAKLSDEPIRDPYPKIGEEAYGKLGRVICLIFVCIHGYMISVVYTILCSEMISHLFHFTLTGMTEAESMRIWMVIFILIIIPLTWFDSPKDNWFVAVIGSVSSAVAMLCILGSYIMLTEHISVHSVKATEIPSNVILNLAVNFGIFVLAFTGATVFPTIQTDMKQPEKFNISMLIGYSGCFLIYVPVMVGGFILFDHSIKSNILLSLRDAMTSSNESLLYKIFIYTAVASFVAHFVTGTIIQVNPVVQLVEGYFNVPEGVHWKRCLLRTCFMLAICGFAEAVPNFEPIMSFLGGTVNMYLCVVFPAAFYLALKKDMASFEKICIYLIIGIAIFFSGVIGFINGRTMIKIMWNTKPL